ncbi:unnamed protein product [Sphagnum jensenii]|uniref:Uncharacterized protein n=1 Tax=Sphagnum jensenii TaxID=128206 RepID=A0ABP1AL36_9BRYO
MANTGNRDSLELNEESASTRQGTRFKSPITQEFQELEGEEITRVELTSYGSAPEEHWTELAKDPQDEDFVIVEESSSEVHLMDLHLSEQIAEGGQANVFFADCEKFSTPVVVKRLKYGQVDLLKLRRRLDKVMRLVRERSSPICRVMAVGKDKSVDIDGTNGWRFAKPHRSWCALCGLRGRWADALCEGWADAI